MAAVLEIEGKKISAKDKKKNPGDRIRRLRTLLASAKQEQSDTFEYIKKSLDEDRPSNRRLSK